VSSRARIVAVGAALAVCLAAPTAAQVPDGPAAVPPPGQIVERQHDWALGFSAGRFAWDDDAPFDDIALVGATVERELWPGIRGRGGVAYGVTDFAARGTFGPGVTDEALRGDVRVWSFDLQLLAGPAFGPFMKAGVFPYVVGGFGTIVTDANDAGDLLTRNQSQWSFGGGVRVRVARRWEVRAEGTSVGMRLADPFEFENRETDTIHNTRWEGRVSWLF